MWVIVSIFLSLRVREAKDPRVGSRETMTPSTVQPPPLTQTSSTASSTLSPIDVCRVQVRLPNGRVSRHNFLAQPASMISLTPDYLDDVETFVH